MAETCASRAGSALTAEPKPVDILAMELDKTGCSRECVVLIASQAVEAVETRGGGFESTANVYLAGLYRYHLGPLVDEGSRLPYLVEGGGVCERKISFESETRCLEATPIEGYSADYLVRNRAVGDLHASVRPRSFEIVDRRSGTVFAWTAAFFTPRHSRSSTYDVPLGFVFERRGGCENNGPDLTDFIYSFLDASR